jgi:hypothetical protein
LIAVASELLDVYSPVAIVASKVIAAPSFIFKVLLLDVIL